MLGISSKISLKTKQTKLKSDWHICMKCGSFIPSFVQTGAEVWADLLSERRPDGHGEIGVFMIIIQEKIIGTRKIIIYFSSLYNQNFDCL